MKQLIAFATATLVVAYVVVSYVRSEAAYHVEQQRALTAVTVQVQTAAVPQPAPSRWMYADGTPAPDPDQAISQ